MKKYIAIILIVLFCILASLFIVAPPYSIVYNFLWDGIEYDGAV